MRRRSANELETGLRSHFLGVSKLSRLLGLICHDVTVLLITGSLTFTRVHDVLETVSDVETHLLGLSGSLRP